MKAWIAASLDQGDDLETALQELRDGLWLRTAEGTNLDTLGKVYGELRAGRDDTTYRQAIQVRAATVVNGTPDEITTFLELAFGTPGLSVIPQYPAAFYIPDSPATTAQLQTIAPAGVGVFAASFLATVESVSFTTVEGDPIVVADKGGTATETIQDTLDADEIWQDTLSGPYDTIQDTLEP